MNNIAKPSGSYALRAEGFGQNERFVPIPQQYSIPRCISFEVRDDYNVSKLQSYLVKFRRLKQTIAAIELLKVLTEAIVGWDEGLTGNMAKAAWLNIPRLNV